MNYIYQKEQNNGENSNPEPEQSMRLGAKELKNMIEKFKNQHLLLGKVDSS